ncbi:uncharacterized protein LOC116960304 [Tyto alba]|uniref:uncharacterized protein LOC116960304 n=1 Tax=Tyto alba TaxID=56313 RepID=UPI001C68114B|nr:uncharacterized protein LOC116960304 [Tyto alba]
MFPSLPCIELTVSPGMYRSLYKRDYRWCEEYKPPNEEDVQKLQIADSQLKAKEFAIPQEEQAMTYSDNVVGERRGVIPAPIIKASSCAADAGGRKPEGSAYSPKALQQRKHFTSVLPVAESYLPKYYPDTELAATRQRNWRSCRLSLRRRMSCLIASIFQLLLRLLEQQGCCCAGRSWPRAGPPTSSSTWRRAGQSSIMLSKTGT